MKSKECDFCNEVGLPILLVRYAVLEQTCPFPEITEPFDADEPAERTKSDLEGLPATIYRGPDAAGATGTLLGIEYEQPASMDMKYTLRTLRNGFVYARVEYDGVFEWLGYQVENGRFYKYITFMQTGKSVPGDLDKSVNQANQRQVSTGQPPCRQAGNQQRCLFVTVKEPDKAKEVRLAYSDVMWSPETFKHHIENDEVIERMRALDVQPWLKGRAQQPHLTGVDQLEKVVAEFCPDLADEENLRKARLGYSDMEKEIMKAQKQAETGQGDAVSADYLEPFNSLCRPAQAGEQEDAAAEVKEISKILSSYGGKEADNGLIMALDDPVGIVTYINSYMLWRLGRFSAGFEGGAAGDSGGNQAAPTGGASPPPSGENWNRNRDTILSAANEAGVDPDLMTSMARIESNFDAAARAGTSSAKGLYQFTDSTWRSTLARHGAKYGLGPNTSPFDARANSLMAAEFMKDNQRYLQNNVGGNISNTDIYMAHFLGPAGAARFLNGMRNNPGASAVDLVDSRAAAANRSVFYHKNGQPKSADEVYQSMNNKMGGGSSSASAAQSAGAGQGEGGDGDQAWKIFSAEGLFALKRMVVGTAESEYVSNKLYGYKAYNEALSRRPGGTLRSPTRRSKDMINQSRKKSKQLDEILNEMDKAAKRKPPDYATYEMWNKKLQKQIGISPEDLDQVREKAWAEYQSLCREDEAAGFLSQFAAQVKQFKKNTIEQIGLKHVSWFFSEKLKHHFDDNFDVVLNNCLHGLAMAGIIARCIATTLESSDTALLHIALRLAEDIGKHAGNLNELRKNLIVRGLFFNDTQLLTTAAKDVADETKHVVPDVVPTGPPPPAKVGLGHEFVTIYPTTTMTSVFAIYLEKYKTFNRYGERLVVDLINNILNSVFGAMMRLLGGNVRPGSVRRFLAFQKVTHYVLKYAIRDSQLMVIPIGGTPGQAMWDILLESSQNRGGIKVPGKDEQLFAKRLSQMERHIRIRNQSAIDFMVVIPADKMVSKIELRKLFTNPDLSADEIITGLRKLGINPFNQSGNSFIATNTHYMAGTLSIVGGVASLFNVYFVVASINSKSKMDPVTDTLMVFGAALDAIGGVVEGVGYYCRAREIWTGKVTSRAAQPHAALTIGRGVSILGASCMILVDAIYFVEAVSEEHYDLAWARFISVGLGLMSIALLIESLMRHLLRVAGWMGVVVFSGMVTVQMYISYRQKMIKIENLKTALNASYYGTHLAGLINGKVPAYQSLPEEIVGVSTAIGKA